MPTPICHHFFPTGQPCGSPALRGEQFCFYHHPTRRRPRTAGRKPRLPAFHFPTLADSASIQRSLAKVAGRVHSRGVDPAKASLMLYALQLLNQNLATPSHPLNLLIHQTRLSLKNCTKSTPKSFIIIT